MKKNMLDQYNQKLKVEKVEEFETNEKDRVGRILAASLALVLAVSAIFIDADNKKQKFKGNKQDSSSYTEFADPKEEKTIIGYSVPAGYIRVGNKGYKVSPEAEAIEPMYLERYVAPAGWILEGNKIYQESPNGERVYTDAIVEVVPVAQEGYVLVVDKCYRREEVTVVDATPIYADDIEYGHTLSLGRR